jgi:hypothetical protein
MVRSPDDGWAQPRRKPSIPSPHDAGRAVPMAAELTDTKIIASRLVGVRQLETNNEHSVYCGFLPSSHDIRGSTCSRGSDAPAGVEPGLATDWQTAGRIMSLESIGAKHYVRDAR